MCLEMGVGHMASEGSLCCAGARVGRAPHHVRAGSSVPAPGLMPGLSSCCWMLGTGRCGHEAASLPRVPPWEVLGKAWHRSFGFPQRLSSEQGQQGSGQNGGSYTPKCQELATARRAAPSSRPPIQLPSDSI